MLNSLGKKSLTITLLFLIMFVLALACNETIVGPQINTDKIFFLSGRDGNPNHFFPGSKNKDVFVMNADGNNQVNLTNSPDSDFVSIVLSRNNKKIIYQYYTPIKSFYYIMNIDGTQKRILASTSYNSYVASFSPDGQEIIFSTSNPQNDIIIIDLNGNEVINLTAKTGIGGNQARFSPDGKKICFYSQSSELNPYNIFITSRDGSDTRQLTNDTLSYYSRILFSLDGKQIFFAGNDQHYSGNEIFSVNVDGSNFRELTNTNFQFLYILLEISPDGESLLFTKQYSNDPSIYSMKLDGTGLKQITYSNAAVDGVYTSDGNNIIYTQMENGKYQIFEMEYDGTQKRNLSNNAFSDIYPVPNF